VQLEDPLLTALHQQLVIEGDFAAVEQKIREAAQAGLFDDYIAGGQYKYVGTLGSGRNGAAVLSGCALFLLSLP